MLRSADVETDGREEEMRVSDRRAADGVSKESTIYAEEWWTMGVLQQPGSVLAQVKLNRLIEEPGVLFSLLRDYCGLSIMRFTTTWLTSESASWNTLVVTEWVHQSVPSSFTQLHVSLNE